MSKKLHIIPLFGEESLLNEEGKSEASTDSQFSKISYTHGYGLLSKAGCVVMQGVTGEVNISLEVTTYDSSAYEQVTNEIEQYVKTDTYNHLTESEHKRNYNDWFFWLFSDASSDYQHYKDSSSESVTINNQKVTNTMDQKFSENRKTMKVNGTFKVTGNTIQPTEVYLYIETLNIKTADGQTTTIINSDPVIADKDGNTDVGNVTDGKLHIVPIGG